MEELSVNTAHEQQGLGVDSREPVTPEYDVVSELTSNPSAAQQRPTATKYVMGAGLISAPGII